MQDSLLKKERAAQLARDKLILELRLQNRAAETGSCGAIPASASTSSGLDSTFSCSVKKNYELIVNSVSKVDLIIFATSELVTKSFLPKGQGGPRPPWDEET